MTNDIEAPWEYAWRLSTRSRSGRELVTSTTIETPSGSIHAGAPRKGRAARGANVASGTIRFSGKRPPRGRRSPLFPALSISTSAWSRTSRVKAATMYS